MAEVGAISITSNKTVVPYMLAAEVAQDSYLVHEYLHELERLKIEPPNALAIDGIALCPQHRCHPPCHPHELG